MWMDGGCRVSWKEIKGPAGSAHHGLFPVCVVLACSKQKFMRPRFLGVAVLISLPKVWNLTLK